MAAAANALRARGRTDTISLHTLPFLEVPSLLFLEYQQFKPVDVLLNHKEGENLAPTHSHIPSNSPKTLCLQSD